MSGFIRRVATIIAAVAKSVYRYAFLVGALVFGNATSRVVPVQHWQALGFWYIFYSERISLKARNYAFRCVSDNVTVSELDKNDDYDFNSVVVVWNKRKNELLSQVLIPGRSISAIAISRDIPTQFSGINVLS